MLNPWAHGRKPPRIERRTLEDARTGETLELALKEADPCLQEAALELAHEYIQTWMVGKDGKPPQRFPAPDGQPVVWSKGFLSTIAFLELMQVPAQGEEPINFVSWVGFKCCLPGIWDGASALADELVPELDEGNASGGEQQPGSGPACKPPDNTRKSRRAETPSSARSTNGKGASTGGSAPSPVPSVPKTTATTTRAAIMNL